MTAEQAFNVFWNSFDLPAFLEDNVPTGQTLPYITYQAPVASFSESVAVNVSIYDEQKNSHSAFKFLAEKANEISERIGNNGTQLACDDGGIWIKRGTPFSQSMNDETNPQIKRKLLLITAEFLTIN